MDLDQVRQGDRVPIMIHYFRGWDFRSSHRRRIPERLELPNASCAGLRPDGAKVVMLSRDYNFSWGSGPTCTTNYVVLYPQGRLGVRGPYGSVYRWPITAVAAPTWEWMRDDNSEQP